MSQPRRKRPSDGQRLTARRKALGLSQQQLADGTGVTLRTIQRWEASDDLAAMRQMLALASALETTPEELLQVADGSPRSRHELEVERRLDRVEGLLASLARDRQTVARESAELIRQELGVNASPRAARAKRPR